MFRSGLAEPKRRSKTPRTGGPPVKVLQKLGKADETKDEQFEGFVQNFKKQEVEGSRLQRELKSYLAAVKGMQQATMNLTESLHDVYEADWNGKDDVLTIGKNCDSLWEDFHQQLVDSSLITLDTYLGQFPDIKTRIAKRSRKLIDYDSARHHMETLQASNIRNERKIAKAEEEFNKAQKVFEELNVDLQEELPSLWDSRVGFYVNTFKNVTDLESKFHREISLLCHQLFEVMTSLGEQHADKAFTIKGAPSDSGPLRLARTPSPAENESPPASPVTASPNHMLAPVSPGPPRPKSPSQLRKGPPLPPPPKLTPTKELRSEQIISLFDDNFVPDISITAPSQEQKTGESLLDLDFDPFKPDSTTPIGQSQSPMSQTLPWDLWTTSAGPPQPVSDSAFNGFSQMDASTSLFTTDSNQSGFGIVGIEAAGEIVVSEGPPVCVVTEPPEVPLTVMVEAESPAGPPLDSALTEKAEKGSPSMEILENMSIPSVVIEPASSNEGDDDRDIISPMTPSDNGELPEVASSTEASTAQETEEAIPSLPPDFLYKVETMHEFEAANSDELDLQKGDVVLVVSSMADEDQDAGWLTGIKESDWLQQGDAASRGLFPANFIQPLP
ncbi:hypothetical protein GJAV_G00070920 [Gymnothorax javanicus]|nr:hypothetical protein GJAV_G00070920 [Gymnothorax javanicus]